MLAHVGIEFPKRLYARAAGPGSLLLGGAMSAVVIGSALPASAATVVQTIDVGTNPTGVSSDGTHIWVTNNLDNTVTEINAFDDRWSIPSPSAGYLCRLLGRILRVGGELR